MPVGPAVPPPEPSILGISRSPLAIARAAAIVATLALVIGSFSLLDRLPGTAGAVNLLANPGFELDADGNGRPDAWSNGNLFTRSNGAAHGGTFAGRFLSTANKRQTSYQQVSVAGGGAYDVSGWVNIPTTGDAFTFQLKVQWRAGSGQLGSVVLRRYTDDTAGAWQEMSGSLVAPAGATTARVQMLAGSLNATVYVDDFSFMAGDEPPPPPPGPPNTTITSGPSGTVASSSAVLSFTASTSTATFECSLDAAGFAPCTSPAGYGGLAPGGHTFQVRAVDAGDTDASPASRTWTVEAQPDQVVATVETKPVPHAGDGADDPAIWVHPTDPSLSLVIGTDKQDGGGLFVYDLAGAELSQHLVGGVNNVDLRDGFPLGGELVSLVAGTGRFSKTLVFARVDVATRSLVDVAGLPATHTGAGFCMYHSPASGKFYAFVTNSGGLVQQFEISDDGTGRVGAGLVRTFDVGATTEGCVADDATGALYISEERVGIWRYGAEPVAPPERSLVDAVGAGNLVADVEGLALSNGPAGARYLVASSQGNDTYSIYEREPPFVHVGTFKILPSATIDGVSETDGIDLTALPVGDAFPGGLFVAHDGENERRTGGHQNFKLVRWDDILESVGITSGSPTLGSAQQPR